MFELSAKIRKPDENLDALREQGFLPVVLYGNKIENLSLTVDRREFEKIYKDAGGSTLISLAVGDKKFSVLIHSLQKHALSGDFIHIDFYQPSLTEETLAKIPLEFIGVAPAEKDLDGTVVKDIQELEVKALPQNLPSKIEVDISGLETFDNNILVKDIKVPENVKIVKEPDEVVVSVSAPTKVEEELEKPIEEGVEEVEKAGEEKKEGEGEETGEEKSDEEKSGKEKSN